MDKIHRILDLCKTIPRPINPLVLRTDTSLPILFYKPPDICLVKVQPDSAIQEQVPQPQ
jgi:hypothetical protein